MLTSSWSAPSNIALVKYWGKHGDQLPINPSLSLSLQRCRTNTRVDLCTAGNSSVSRIYCYDGQIADAQFFKKYDQFLNKMSREHFPWINQYNLRIDTCNTFPHSTGIASSASSIAALTLCLLELNERLNQHQLTAQELLAQPTFLKLASQLSRQGSGSACRSLYATGLWGNTAMADQSSDEWAVDLQGDWDTIAQEWADAVLVVSAQAKKISSSAGHGMMYVHPMKEARQNIANSNMQRLLESASIGVQTGDWQSWGKVIEAEAWCLHALMMTSPEPYLLMAPNTVELLQRLVKWRNTHQVRAFFSMDAGPNIHLIYHLEDRERVLSWIETEARMLLDQGQWIDDRFGGRPMPNHTGMI